MTPKFKKGDRVRSTVARLQPPVQKGQEFTVLDMSRGSLHALCRRTWEDGDGKTFLPVAELELIEENDNAT